MTEKQYKLERWSSESLYYSFPTGSVHQGVGYVIEKVEKDLNQLADENEQLKQELEELKEIGDYQADRIKELQEFEDKVFDSLNDKIKKGEKAIEWGESSGADVGAMGFHIESLKQFKKELKE